MRTRASLIVTSTVCVTAILFLKLPEPTVESYRNIAPVAGNASARNQDPEFALHYWEDPDECLGCHYERYVDWSSSQMSRAFTGDFFQAQYYQITLEDARRDPEMAGLAADCIGCHSPTAFMSGMIPPPAARTADDFWDQSWPWLGSFRTLGQLDSAVGRDLPGADGGRYGNAYPAMKQGPDRGVFCDLCHTFKGFSDLDPFNHNYISDAGPGIDPKRADLEFPWSPSHPNQLSELFETADLCGMCHNEQNSIGQWVKATHIEWSETEYEGRDIPCQFCHMPPREGKPAKMGPQRDWNHAHWFGGGFTGFVEGAARVVLQFHEEEVRAGTTVPLQLTVGELATGHHFPTGATEERDVWLHLGVYDADGNELQHIRVPPNPDDPNDQYFITSSSAVAYPTHSSYSDAILRDDLPDGDRLYHDVFLDSDGNVTFGQWYAVEIVGNRLVQGETRIEQYDWEVPSNLAGQEVYLRATLWFRRMADSHADVLGIERRLHLLVSKDEKLVSVVR